MADVHQLPGTSRIPAKDEPVEAVIVKLKEWLAQARRGEIQGIGAAIVSVDGYAREGFVVASGRDLNVLMAAASVLNYRICKYADETASEVDPGPVEEAE